MNDPHVESLLYKVTSVPGVDYDRAISLSFLTDDFACTVDNGNATFRLRGHYANEEGAKAAVQPFVDSWRIWSDIVKSPGEFSLRFVAARIVDRAPTQTAGVRQVPLGLAVSVETAASVAIHASRTAYPEPPLKFRTSPLVDAMHYQYEGALRDRVPLAAAGYCCLSFLEGGAGNRSNAASQFAISDKVLKTLARLSTERGGRAARKYAGLTQDFTSKEREWVLQILKLIILRAGEKEANPQAVFSILTMGDLPKL